MADRGRSSLGRPSRLNTRRRQVALLAAFVVLAVTLPGCTLGAAGGFITPTPIPFADFIAESSDGRTDEPVPASSNPVIGVHADLTRTLEQVSSERMMADVERLSSIRSRHVHSIGIDRAASEIADGFVSRPEVAGSWSSIDSSLSTLAG